MTPIRVIFSNFVNGLFIMGADDDAFPGFLREASGVAQLQRGVLKSRFGSTLDFTTAAAPHSITRFAGMTFAGVGSTLLRNGQIVKTGLSGSRILFLPCASTVGVLDQLFCIGGGSLFKVNRDGLATGWGIAAPSSALTAVDSGVAGNPNGTYKYRVTFKNSASGHHSNGNSTDATVTVGSKKISLTAIPVSTDAQVDSREIWRTVASGSTYFLLTTIADNTSTTYTDNTLDASLASTELETDNNVPASTLTFAAGPHVGRMWFGGNTTAGLKGRVYYSPINRLESQQGFLDISYDDDPGQRLVIWNGNLFFFTSARIFQILGFGSDGIFTWQEVFGAPGTTQPFTVCPTPLGIFYQAEDGVRLFNGAASQLAANEAVRDLFRGVALEGIPAFEGAAACYGRNEYYITDLTTTLGLNTLTSAWRNLGKSTNGLFYDIIDKELYAGFTSGVYRFEKENTETDAGAAISLRIKTAAIGSKTDERMPLLYLLLDIDTNGQFLLVTLFMDDSTTVVLPLFQTAARQIVRFKLNRYIRKVAVMISGSVTKQVRLYAITLLPFIPRKADVQPVESATPFGDIEVSL